MGAVAFAMSGVLFPPLRTYDILRELNGQPAVAPAS